MATKTKDKTKKSVVDDQKSYTPTEAETKILKEVYEDFVKGRSVIMKTYPQFNGRPLYTCIDDWQKRWNGFIPAGNPLMSDTQSRIFLNITRNIILSYLGTVAQQMPKPKIEAVNKKSGLGFQQLAIALQDMNTNSLNNENGEAKYFNVAFEAAVKGTVIEYEGYAKTEQDVPIVEGFDPVTGAVKWKKGTRTIADDCFQQLVPVEDFLFGNPYQPDVQLQPFIIWQSLTTLVEAEMEYGHYPNFKHVKAGNYQLFGTVDTGTFYRNGMSTGIEADKVQIVRWYNRSKNKHCVAINGVLVYSGPIPFKHGKYPFAKTIFEPFDPYFFWGAGFPNKIMGEQDLINTFWNMMADKTFASLLPTGLSSDLDDWIDDDVLEVNKFRKVGDINNWKFLEMPGVTGGEVNMLQQAVSFMKENAGTYGGAQSFTPRGGKLQTRQVMLQQQESQKKISIPAGFLEDFERDRTELRVKNMLQFYSIPRIERITGKGGKEIEELSYRDIRVENAELSDGKKGTKVIKLVDDTLNNPNKREKLKNDLAIMEEKGEINGEPIEAIALDVDSFEDFDYKVQIVRGSTFQQNQILDQAVRHDYANWRLGIAKVVPVDAQALVDWVDESHDLDPDQFKPKQIPGEAQPSPFMGQDDQGAPAPGGDQANVMQQLLAKTNSAGADPSMGGEV